MPLIDDRPKVKIPIYKIIKRYTIKYFDFTEDFYSFLPDCEDAKTDRVPREARFSEFVGEPVFVGNFITQREFQFCEFFGRKAIEFPPLKRAIFAEELQSLLFNENEKCYGRFYRSRKK
jgi:hypothetical protein